MTRYFELDFKYKGKNQGIPAQYSYPVYGRPPLEFTHGLFKTDEFSLGEALGYGHRPLLNRTSFGTSAETRLSHTQAVGLKEITEEEYESRMSERSGEKVMASANIEKEDTDGIGDFDGSEDARFDHGDD